MLTKKGRKFQTPDINNIKSKLKEIGLDIEYVIRKEDIIIYLIYYLGGISLEQLCFLFGDLETSIRTSISKILRKGDIIEIKKNEINNTFYLPTRKTLNELKEFCDVKENRNYRNIKHLCKVNDFFLMLFSSSCSKVTVEYEKSIKSEVIDEFIVRADAIINVEDDENQYEFLLEQDNNTEKITKLYEKIENYYNVILHEKLQPEIVKFYYFRFDILFNKNYVAKFENLLKRSGNYKDMLDEVVEIQDFYYEVKNGGYPEEYYESRADVFDVEYSKRQNILLRNISMEKSELIKKLDEFKRNIRLELANKILRDRIKNVKETMLKEFVVKTFDNDSISTVYHSITRHKSFESINSKIEAEELLLRTNILCGDRKSDYVLKNILFGTPYREEHLLKTIIKESLGKYGVNHNALRVKQIFKTVGNETLCFSNYCTVHLNKENCDVDCVLLMPSISVSDDCRIEYLLNLDLMQINNSFVNTTFFFIISTDKQTESTYDEKIKRKNSASKVRFYVYPINI